MHSLSAAEILEAWERGLNQSSNQRALTLLSCVYPQASFDSLSGLSIGRRDAELLALRERTFGPLMAAIVGCPECGRQSDITLDTTALRSAGPEDTAENLALTVAGYELQLRLPNSEDLALLSGNQGADGGRKWLLDRCVLSVQFNGAPAELDALTNEIEDALSERMAQADPLADIQLALSCPFCGHRWKALFDIVSFLWREIDNLAGRVLRDVHALASAYGWSEKDILALSPARRQFYLALTGI